LSRVPSMSVASSRMGGSKTVTIYLNIRI
jgi:hypothetical protein